MDGRLVLAVIGFVVICVVLPGLLMEGSLDAGLDAMLASLGPEEWFFAVFGGLLLFGFLLGVPLPWKGEDDVRGVDDSTLGPGEPPRLPPVPDKDDLPPHNLKVPRTKPSPGGPELSRGEKRRKLNDAIGKVIERADQKKEVERKRDRRGW